MDLKACCFAFINSEAVSYPEAWPGTTVCYSKNVEDPDSWKRNQDTFYMDGKLCWEHDHMKNESIFFRYGIRLMVVGFTKNS